MKIVKFEGCTTADLIFDGVSASELSDVKIAAILDYLLPKVRDGVITSTISLSNVVELFRSTDSYWSDHKCEQCGDTRSSTTWEI